MRTNLTNQMRLVSDYQRNEKELPVHRHKEPDAGSQLPSIFAESVLDFLVVQHSPQKGAQGVLRRPGDHRLRSAFSAYS